MVLGLVHETRQSVRLFYRSIFESCIVENILKFVSNRIKWYVLFIWILIISDNENLHKQSERMGPSIDLFLLFLIFYPKTICHHLMLSALPLTYVIIDVSSVTFFYVCSTYVHVCQYWSLLFSCLGYTSFIAVMNY